MTIQLSTRLRNARLDVIETTIGNAGILRIRAGAPPANAATARTGAVLATVPLPADWANAAANAQKTLLGTWADANGADATGAAGHFEIEGAGAVIDMQGTVTITGGGGDMEVDNTSFAVGQPFSVTSFTMNEPNG